MSVGEEWRWECECGGKSGGGSVSEEGEEWRWECVSVGGEEWRWECVSVGKSPIFWTHMESAGRSESACVCVCVCVCVCIWGRGIFCMRVECVHGDVCVRGVHV